MRRSTVWLAIFIAGIILVVGVVLAIRSLSLPPKPQKSISSKGKPVIKEEKMGSFKLSLYLPKEKFKVGESVFIRLILENVSSSSETLHFNSGQKFDFIVRDLSGEEVWIWSKDKVFIQAITEEIFEPRQKKIYQVNWEQKDFQGNPVPSGSYLIQGKSMAQGLDGIVSTQIETSEGN